LQVLLAAVQLSQNVDDVLDTLETPDLPKLNITLRWKLVGEGCLKVIQQFFGYVRFIHLTVLLI